MGRMNTMNASADSMAMSAPMMVFLSSTMTPLYSAAWSPATTGHYAGTCVFIVILAAIFRGLIAMRAVQAGRWALAEKRRPYVIASTKVQAQVITEQSLDGKEGRGVIRPWRLSVDVPRACIDTVIAGVGYLLMLAVMTMNVGYFMSVLGGTFLGSLAIGRYQS